MMIRDTVVLFPPHLTAPWSFDRWLLLMSGFVCHWYNPTTRTPNSSSPRPLSLIIRVNSALIVFLKHGQLDFSGASDISDHLTLIF